MPISGVLFASRAPDVIGPTLIFDGVARRYAQFAFLRGSYRITGMRFI